MKKELIASEDIQELLLDIGIPTHLLGFAYIAHGLELAFDNPEYIMRIGKLMYADVAKQYNTTPLCVERCIRHAIHTGWTSGNYELLSAVFRNYTVENIPANRRFLSELYYFIITVKKQPL